MSIVSYADNDKQRFVDISSIVSDLETRCIYEEKRMKTVKRSGEELMDFFIKFFDNPRDVPGVHSVDIWFKHDIPKGSIYAWITVKDSGME